MVVSSRERRFGLLGVGGVDSEELQLRIFFEGGGCPVVLVLSAMVERRMVCIYPSTTNIEVDAMPDALRVRISLRGIGIGIDECNLNNV